MESKDFSSLKIKEYKHWILFLHENQCYLGRMYLLAKDTSKIDFMEMSLDEREEFFKIGSEIKKVLNRLFLPDKINYTALGNVFERLHVHFIPRYKSKKDFLGMGFTDTRWGKNYAPYDTGFKIDSAILGKIKCLIRDNLEI